MARTKKKAVIKPRGRQIAHAGFTPKRQMEFLALLSVGWAIKHAAEKVGVTKQAVYDLRKSDPAFAAAWEEAKENGMHRLEEEASRRAMGWADTWTDKDGVEHTAFKYSDTLMIFLLKSMDPRKYRESMDININERRHILIDLVQVEKDEDTGRLMLVDENQPPLLTSGEGNDG